MPAACTLTNQSQPLRFISCFLGLFLWLSADCQVLIAPLCYTRGISMWWLIFCINQTNNPIPVILSEAPAKFVPCRIIWREVEGSRGCLLYHTAAGNSVRELP